MGNVQKFNNVNIVVKTGRWIISKNSVIVKFLNKEQDDG
jgi:hypothetical protein